MAEQILRAKMADSSITVFSAGVRARNGESMPDEAAKFSRYYGGSPESHRSRLLDIAHLQATDLVLTATRTQRASVVQMLPRMSRKTFTIAEFVRLVQSLDSKDWQAISDLPHLIEAVRSMRGQVLPPDDPADDDLEDPYRRSIEVYQTVAMRLDFETTLIADALSMRPQFRDDWLV
jgi:protein-tyrosine phosphatase